jgi:PadR family transcriptional regulator
MRSTSLGEFEHLLLLTVLRLGADAYGLDIARELGSRADRWISRGALYSSLDRLQQKGLVRWKAVEGSPLRDGMPRRLYAVTPSGVAALRESRKVLRRMWRGLEPLLKDPTP